jgi:hypothetical protein
VIDRGQLWVTLQHLRQGPAHRLEISNVEHVGEQRLAVTGSFPKKLGATVGRTLFVAVERTGQANGDLFHPAMKIGANLIGTQISNVYIVEALREVT